HFSDLYVATVRSSERTGNVREALARFVAYQEEAEKVRKKIIAALIYPTILLVVGTGVLAFLMLYVVPRFARVYEDMTNRLPFFSTILLSCGRWIEQHTLAVLLLLAALLGATIWAFSTEAFRAALVSRLWRIGPVGERLRVYQLARLYRSV